MFCFCFLCALSVLCANSESWVLGLRPRVVLHFGCPLQEAHQLLAFAEHESPEFQEAYLIHLEAAVGLHAPAQIGAAPRSQMVSARGIPQESKHMPHIRSVSQEC